MCLTCAAMNPFDPMAGFDLHLASAGGSNGSGTASAPSNAPYTWDQIAGQLTDGYWGFTGGNWRAFALDTSRTLTYDISGLSAGAQKIALAAMEAWTEASGIKFVATSSQTTVTRTETADSGAGTAAGYTLDMTKRTVFNGSFGTNGDADSYRVVLEAGKSYQFTATSATGDVVLRLLDSSGNQVMAKDAGFSGEAETMTVTMPAGTYYVAVNEYNGDTGNYTLTANLAGADITFDDTDTSGAYATSELSGNEILSSAVNIPDNWNFGDMSLNGYMFQTYMHELGHALGLGHAGNYNGNANWPSDALYDNDSWLATVMSYFNQEDNTIVPGSLAYLATVMPADLIAIQNLYGFAGATNAGNTTYGLNSNMGGYLQKLLNMWTGALATDPNVYAGEPIAFTIFDSNGTDTVNFSNFSADQTINLNALTSSSVGGLSMNMSIGRGVVIENAIGGSGRDNLVGNEVANYLQGKAGADTLEGGNGDDILAGGLGADRLVGGNGTHDRVLYSDATAGLRVSLTTPTTNTGIAAGDTFIGIEDIGGSNYADTLSGNGSVNFLWGAAGNDGLSGYAGSDSLYGGDGNDVLAGGIGADRLDGGNGSRDRAAYADATSAVRVDLQLPTTNTGIAAGDIFVGIEDLSGSSYGDTLMGNAGSNQLRGMAGNDAVYGRDGGDHLYGGAGNDALTGGNGADAFVFDTTLGATNVDRITDFSAVDDTIRLENAVFTALTAGALGASAFVLGANATTAAHRIIYNRPTGDLYYDSNGSGAGGKVLFATLVDGTALSYSDFLVI